MSQGVAPPHFPVLDVLAEGVLVTDLDGHLLQANAAASAILGVDLETARSVPDWWRRFTTGDDGAWLDTVARTGRAIREVTVEVARADGGQTILSVNYLPLREDGHTISGLVISFSDVTDREREHRRAVSSEERLRQAHEVAKLATWEWWPGMTDDAVFHAPPGDASLPGHGTWLKERLATMPDAESRRMSADFASILAGERDETLTYLHDPSVPVWLETRSRAIRDDDGHVLSIRGTTQDVTEHVLAKRQTAAARDFLAATLDSLAAHVAVLDADGTILTTNRAWDRFAVENGGRAVGAGASYFAACEGVSADEVAEEACAGLRAVIDGRSDAFALEYACHSPTAERWFMLRATRFDGSGRARAVVNHADVTAQHEARAEIARQAALLDQVDVSVVATDADGLVTHWNAGAESLYGWTREEAAGRHIADWVLPSDRELIDGELRSTGRWEGDVTARRKDGASFPAYVRTQAIPGAHGRPPGMSAVSVDMTQRVAAERALVAARNYLSAVTGSIGEGLFTLDTDGRVTYMNAVAESLLGWTAEELAGLVMHDVSHRNADGSSVPIEDCPMFHARRDGKTVRVEDDTFLRRDGRTFAVAYTASPFETDDGVKGCVVVFEEITERKAHAAALQREADTLAWIERIQKALAEDRFALYAQPIVDLHTGEPVQHELLLRMRDPDGTIISPASYLHIAEEYGLVGEIDRWVIERGVAVAARGNAVEINLSARSIGDQTILDHIERCMSVAGADPTLLVFEITETAIVEDEAAARAFAQRLRQLGCKLALDDFGTGFGGFTYLKHIPVDYLKIDIEFVRDLTTNPASGHVVRAVVALAAGFDLKTVAEGVEDAETLAVLHEMGVDFVQGYHFAAPAPVEEVLPG